MAIRDLDWSDVERDAERMRMEQENAEYEAWAAEHADELAEEAYQEWAAIRAADGEDASRTAYEDWLDYCAGAYDD